MIESTPTSGAVLAALPVELARRARHDSSPEVLHVTLDERVPGLPRGSVSVISGDESSELIRRVREAAQARDAAGLSDAMATQGTSLRQLEGARGRMPARVGLERTLEAIPAISQVSYRGKPIAEGMIVHAELDAMRVLVPYAGGELDPKGFVASTYVPPGQEPPRIATLVLVSEPQLSEIEKRALDRLPAEMSQLTLGRGDIADAPGVAAGLLMAEALTANAALEWAENQNLRQHQYELIQQRQAIQERLQGLDRQQDLGRQDERQALMDEMQVLDQLQEQLQERVGDMLQQQQNRQRQQDQHAQQAQEEQQQAQEEQRRQEEQREQQQEQQQQQQEQQRQQEEQRQESDRRQAAAADADHADVGDDDGGSLGRFLGIDVLTSELEGLESGADITRLVELRAGLMMAGRLR